MSEGQGFSEVAERYRAGRADAHELARALDAAEQVAALIPPAEMSRFMQELDAARERKGIGNVKVWDAEQPRMHGRTLEDGSFLLNLFVDGNAGRELAVTSGMIEPDGAAPFVSRSADSFFWDVLVQNFAGLIVDEGTEHELRLDRGACARLYALLTLERFAEQEVVFPLISQGRLCLLKEPSGGVIAVVYGFREAAEHAVGHVSFPEPTAPAMATQEALRTLLAAGVTGVVVDMDLRSHRLYQRRDLVAMLDHLGGGEASPAAEAPFEGDDPHAAVATMTGSGPEEATGEALRLATRFRQCAPIPSPGHDKSGSRRRFDSLRQGAEGQQIEMWEYIDGLAFDLALWVPVHPERVDGLLWPSFYRHPQETDKTLTYAFTQEEAARAAIDPEGGEELVRVSGIELLRWAWGAPRAIDEVAIDLYQGTEGWCTFPTVWALSAIFPHFLEIPSLDDVERVGIAKLGRLPGVRGTKAEVVRALVRGWDKLLEVGADGDEPPGVRVADGEYLPVFSSADAFFDCDAAGGMKPLPRATEPPFARWLSACTELDGVVIDPGADHPVVLEATDLLVLDAWTALGERRPDGTAMVKGVVGHLNDGVIDETTAGRVVADWPRYFVGIQQTDAGVAVLTLPDRDSCALFTSHERAEFYLDVYRQAGVLDSSWQPVPMVARWRDTIFHELERSYTEGGWIDPMPPGAGVSLLAAAFTGGSETSHDPGLVMEGYEGLEIGEEMLHAILERLDEKMKPRAPGFVDSARRNAA